MQQVKSRFRQSIVAFSLVAAALVGGGVVAGAVAASASGGDRATSGDQSKPQRADERLLTGDAAERARAAVLAEYAGATIERLETDSGPAEYEAHIVTADGDRVIVLMDADFTVTGTDTYGG